MTKVQREAKGKSTVALKLTKALEELVIFSQQDQIDIIDLAKCTNTSPEVRDLLSKMSYTLKW